MGDEEGGDYFKGLGLGVGVRDWTSNSSSTSSSTNAPIDSSNIGFKLLKKHGWKEGTGLGVSEQGRLQPVQAFLKTNRKGLGAEKVKKKSEHTRKSGEDKTDQVASGKKAKATSKKVKKMLEFEKHMQEKEFERAFFRDFWPENV